VWREAAAKFGFDGLLMAFYRGVTLGVAFIALWVWTNKIDGSHSNFRDAKNTDGESPYYWAMVTLIACISLGVGFIAYQYLFTELTGNLTDPLIAKGAGVIAFVFFAVVTFVGLERFWNDLEPIHETNAMPKREMPRSGDDPIDEPLHVKKAQTSSLGRITYLLVAGVGVYLIFYLAYSQLFTDAEWSWGYLGGLLFWMGVIPYAWAKFRGGR
jgi:hypothetical protein